MSGLGRVMPITMGAFAIGSLSVIGLPPAAFGLLMGLLGVALTGFRRGLGMRWGLAGAAVCAIALSVNALLYRAPGGLSANVPKNWNEPRPRTFVPPPAPPDF